MNPSDLHDAFEQLSGRVHDPSEADTDHLLSTVRSHQRRRRNVVRLAVSGVAVAVLVVAGVVALDQRSDGRTHVAAGGRFGTPPAAVSGPTAEAWARGTWSELPKPPVDFGADSRAFWVGGRLVVVQPERGTSNMTPSAWIGAAFDPLTGVWTTLPATPRLGQQANVATAGDRLLLWGGVTTRRNGPDLIIDTVSVAVSLDPHSSTWRAIAPPPQAATTAAIATWTGTRLALVGQGPKQDGYRVVTYDPTTDTWSVGDSEPHEDGAYPSSILWTGTDLLVWFDYIPPADGLGWQHLERYDPIRDRWSRVAGDEGRPAVTDVAMAEGTVVGREVATPCGGCRTATQGRTVTIDPVTGAWSSTAAAPTAIVQSVGRPGATASTPDDPGSRQVVIAGIPVRLAVLVDAGQVGADGPGPGTWPMTVMAYGASRRAWVEAVRPSRQLRPIVKDDQGPFTGSPQLIWTGRSLVVWGTFDCIDTADCAQPTSTYGLLYAPEP